MAAQVFLGRPDAARPAQELLWDAIELLVPIASLNYQRVLADAAAHTDAVGQDEKRTDAARVALVADVTAFIGTLDRLRRLIAKLGGAAEVKIARGAFLSVVADYEDARHHLEHLDGAVERLAAEPVAALAMVTWWELKDGHMLAQFLIPGTIRVAMQPQVIVPGDVRPPVDHVTAFIAGAGYDLTRAHDALLALWERLREWSEQFVTRTGTSGESGTSSR